MAIQIRINPDRVRDIANNQKAINSKADEISARLKECTVRLDNAWDGVASEEALQVIERMINASRSLAEDIAESSQRLISVANAFEKVDEGISSPIPVIPFRFKPGFIPINPGLIVWRPVAGQTVRIVPDEVRSIAKRFQKLSNQYNELIDEFFSSVSAVSEVWEGRSHQKYLDETSEFKAGAAEFADALMGFSERLIATAVRFEEICVMFITQHRKIFGFHATNSLK